MTNIKTVLVLLLGLITFNISAQEYVSRYFHYDQYYDATDPFSIKAKSIDGNDFRSFMLAGGGAAAPTRGSYVGLYGNEDVLHGRLLLSAGNDVGDGGIYFHTGGVQHLNIPLSTLPAVDLAYGLSSDTAPVLTIRSNKANAVDDATLQLTGGGSSTLAGSRGSYIQLEGEDVGGLNSGGNINIVGGVGASVADYPVITLRHDTADASDWGKITIAAGGAAAGSRGAYIDLFGNENTAPGFGGALYLRSGAVSGSGISLNPGNSLGYFFAYTGSDADNQLAFAGNSTANAVGTIRSNRSDGSDDSILRFAGGGQYGYDRGASIQLTGNDVGGAGAGAGMTLETGTGTLNALHIQQEGYAKLELLATSDADDVTLVLGQVTTTMPIFSIRSQTADGDDDGKLFISPGGDTTVSRGALLTLFGEQEGTGTGGAYLQASNTVGVVSFSTHGATRFTVADTASSTLPEVIFGRESYAAMTATMRFDTVDGDDDSILQITAGGNSVMSGDRGSYIQLEGADLGGTNRGGDISIVGGIGASATAGQFPTITVRNDTADASDWGKITIAAGGAAAGSRGAYIDLFGNENTAPGIGGALYIRSGAVGGSGISLNPGNSLGYFFAYTGSDADNQLAFSGNSTANAVGTIRSNRSDGSDDSRLRLTGGGAYDTTRGAGIELLGDDVGGAGAGGGITFEAGTGTTATLKFDTAGTNKWTINADGTLDSAVTDIGWRSANSANALCTTTCGANKGCVMGFDQATNTFVNCSDNTADTCICTTT